jgi:hypothetical protein
VVVADNDLSVCAHEEIGLRAELRDKAIYITSAQKGEDRYSG